MQGAAESQVWGLCARGRPAWPERAGVGPGAVRGSSFVGGVVPCHQPATGALVFLESRQKKANLWVSRNPALS